MKFIHIADVHLGMQPDIGYKWSENRAREINETFMRVIDVCNEDKIELLIIAGDLFHKQPTETELKEVDYILSKLVSTKVVIMAGNHDYAPLGSLYEKFTWNDNVYMFSNSKMDSILLDELNTEIYGFSYNDRNITVPRYDDIQPYDNNRINILVGHGGEIDNVPIDFNKLQGSNFDYIALGHIHKFNIFSDKMAYCGSLEPLDRTETGEHGYILGEVTKEKCIIKHMPFASRQYIQLREIVDSEVTNASLIDMIKGDISENGQNNIYHITIDGYRAQDLTFDCDILKDSYNIIDIVDETLPDYDFRILYQENIDNIIGMYISKINGMDIQEGLKKRALYLGIESLMK